MTEMRRLRNIKIFIQTILSFVLSRKIIDMALCLKKKSVEKKKQSIIDMLKKGPVVKRKKGGD